MVRDQDIFAIFPYERPASVPANCVRDDRADNAADGAGKGGAKDREPPLRNEIAREGHDYFAGERDARRFDSHHCHNAGIAERGDRGDDERCEE